MIIGLFFLAITVVTLIAYLLNKSKKDNRKLKVLSQENEFLLSEANYGINNNLQLVAILISNQLKKATVKKKVFNLKIYRPK